MSEKSDIRISYFLWEFNYLLGEAKNIGKKDQGKVPQVGFVGKVKRKGFLYDIT